MRVHGKRAIDEGRQPGVVADLVIDAISTDRFWVLPHPEFVEIAMRRFMSIGEGANPSPPEETPGMPPRDQLVAKIMAAMAAAAEGPTTAE